MSETPTPSSQAAAALARAVQRRLPPLLAARRGAEPLLSRSRSVAAARRPVRVPVDLGGDFTAEATYDLASLVSGVSASSELFGSLENDSYLDLVADRIARLIVKDQSRRTEEAWYAEDRPSKLLGLSVYAPATPSDLWIGGLSPETEGWSPLVAQHITTDPSATAAALIEFSLDCTDDLWEPTLIAAGPKLASDVLRGFQPQQRFCSIRGGIRYLNVGGAEMFWAKTADPDAAFVMHPNDFAFHHTAPLVTVSGGRLVARVDQQLVCSRRYLLGRFQRYASLQF